MFLQELKVRQGIERGPGNGAIALYRSFEHQVDGFTDQDLLSIDCGLQDWGWGLRLSGRPSGMSLSQRKPGRPER
jgi:hypothetical protein